jgi:hypothetical protein
MSDALIDELTTMWTLLADRPAKLLRTGKVSLHLGGRPFTAALDVEGSRHLLIPVGSATDQPGLWRSATIAVSRRNLRGDDRLTRTWLDLHCRRPELDGVFARLAAAVAESLAAVHLDSIEEVCLSVLGDWRDLFGSGRPQGESVTGLLGELLVLERLANVDRVQALASWTGPEGGRHDFRRGTHAIEVKSTTRRIGKFVQIHGLWQLLVPDDGDLHLAFIRLERVPGGSLSIATIVRRLASLGLSVSTLAEVLVDAGIGDMAGEPANVAYELREWTWYLVGPGFPRIVPDSFPGATLPAGVTDISYGIDLSSLPAIGDPDSGAIISGFFGEPTCAH